MRAARSAALWMASRSRRVGSSSRRPASRSAQARIVASGLFSSCATPDIVCPSGRELFGLRQLEVQIARLILQLLALGDVAHHRFDAQSVGAGQPLGARRDFDPHGRAVGAPQAQQVIVARAVAGQLLQEIARAPARRRTDRGRTAGRRCRAPRPAAAEHQAQMRIGGERRRFVEADEADVDAFAQRIEQAGERVVVEPAGAREVARRTSSGHGLVGRRPGLAAAASASVCDCHRPGCTSSRSPRGSRRATRRRCASDARQSRRRCRLRRSSPCGTHSVTRPLRVALLDEAVVVALWPARSQPQKHGMYFSTSG